MDEVSGVICLVPPMDYRICLADKAGTHYKPAVIVPKLVCFSPLDHSRWTWPLNF